MPDNIRDFNNRGEIHEQFRGQVADNFEAGNEALAAQLENADEQYTEGTFGRDRDRPHEAIVNKDEKGRVTEINAEYLDMMLEKYLTSMLEAERQLEERKCSGGWLGRVGRFLNETDLGKVLKTGTKVVGGVGLSVAATFGSFGIGSPMALALASRTAADGIGEFIQYFGTGQHRNQQGELVGFGGERGALQQIRDAKNRRAEQILNLMQIRNRIHNDDDRSIGMSENVLDGQGGQINMGVELGRIIEALDAIEQEIGEGESDLAHIRSMGRTIRAVANTAVSGGIVGYQLLHGGLAMGVQQFGGSGHEVKMFSNGVHFLYNSGEQVAQTAIPHLAAGHDAVLGIGHTLGSNAPWGAIYGVGIGTAAGILGTAAYEMTDAARQGAIAANPGTRPVFTLRGRTESGNASQEISGKGPSNPESMSENKEATLESIKEQITPGSVWEWNIGNRAKQLVEIVSAEDGKIKFYLLNADGERENNTINEYSGQENIRNGKKIATSVEEFKDNQSIDDTVKSVAKEYHIKVPQEGEKWRIRAGLLAPKLKPVGVFAGLGADIDLLEGETIEIKQLGEKRRTANITIRGTKGHIKQELIVSTESILRNCVPKSGIIATGEARAELGEGEEGEHAQVLNTINEKLKERRVGPSQIEKDQIYIIRGKWYVIGDVNEDTGVITLWKGNLDNGKVPDDKSLKIRPNFDTVTFESFSSLIESAPKILYRDKVAPAKKEGDGGSKGKNKGAGGGGGQT